MAISLYEQFTAVDWARYANISGQAAAGICIGVPLLSLVFNMASTLFLHFGVFLWTLCSGLLIAIWELPLIYNHVPPCTKLRTTCLDELHIRLPIVRTLLYTFLSLFIMVGGSIFLLAGFVLFVSGILYAFAAVNLQADQIGATFQPGGNDKSIGAFLHI